MATSLASGHDARGGWEPPGAVLVAGTELPRAVPMVDPSSRNRGDGPYGPWRDPRRVGAGNGPDAPAQR